MKKTSVVLACVLAFSAPSAFARILFQDDFESGNLSHTENGARWTDSASTRVNSLKPRTGKYALEFKYQGVPDGQDSWSEQRFELGGRYSEIWIKYDLYVPTNYYHRTQGGDSANNKGFAHLWAGEYGGGPGLAAGFEFWPDGSGVGKVSFHPWRPANPHYMDDSRNSRGIELSDRGKWIQILLQVKAATAGKSDGQARVWKTTEGGTRQLIYEKADVNMYNADGNYFERGYLFGYANSGFSETTILYVDNLVIADSPIDVLAPAAPQALNAE